MTNFVIHGDLYHMDREFKHKTLHGKKKKKLNANKLRILGMKTLEETILYMDGRIRLKALNMHVPRPIWTSTNLN